MKNVLLVLGVFAGALVAQNERQLLQEKLHEDPFVLLRALGSASDPAAAEALAGPLQERLATDQALRIRLVRLGFAADEPAVVFGAAVLQGTVFLPVPELRHAAEVIVAHFGDRDCPVPLYAMIDVEGSRDVPAALARIPKLPDAVAVNWLDELHRLVRPEHVPVLCALALQTKGDVRCSAFLDAWFPATYSGQHVPLVVQTWLQLVGGTPDADGDGLPGVLTAALRWQVEHAPPPAEAADAPRQLRDPWLICSRWLAAGRAGARDLPLLRKLIEREESFTAVALRALGSLKDAESEALLRHYDSDKYHDFRLAARTALAIRGDAPAKAQLRTGSYDALACWFAAATAAERKDYCRQLLTAPVPEALAQLHAIGSMQQERMPAGFPFFEETWLDGLEAMAADQDLDAAVLRTLVAVVPGCATRRLADKLLTHSATELFAAPTNQNESEPRGDVGFIGVWPFLEVTAPATFRVRLREGLASSEPAIRDQCGELLLRLHDAGSAAALASWMPENSDYSWLLLARCGAPARDALTARLRDEKGSERWDPFAARDLAVALGMPFELAEDFRFDNEPQPGQLASLLAGDAASAFLAAVAARTDLTASELLPAVSWNDARVQAAVRPRLERAAAEDAYFQLALGVARRDPATLATVRELLADGRYATHHIPTRGVLTLGRDPQMLAFWIDEFGANCCRRCNAEEAMSELFYRDNGEAWDQEGEPTGARLRRLLLPNLGRLRWSELAHGYVVAGR